MKTAGKGHGYLLGIDGGGTGCRAQLVSWSGEVLGNGEAGPANPLRAPERTCRSIMAATDQALSEAGLGHDIYKQISAGIGLAGVNVPAAFDSINSWDHPFKSMFLTTDMRIACQGAHGKCDGAVIIAGTGCSGYSIVRGIHRTHSGFGFPFGDMGGSAWIGLEGLRATFIAIDKLGPATALEEILSAHFGVSGIGIVEKMANAQPCDFGRLAPLVFAAADEEDRVAVGIVEKSAAYISSLAHVIQRLNPNRMSLVGGLSETITPWLAPDVIQTLSPAMHTALDGAILYLKEQILAGEASSHSKLQ